MAYKIGIDVGGTFTDFLLTQDDGDELHLQDAVDAQGPLHRHHPGHRGDGGRPGPRHRGLPARGGDHRPRHDRHHQRHPHLPGGEDRPAHHRGLPRRARDAARHPRGAVQQPLRERAAGGRALPAPPGQGAGRLRRRRARARWTRRRCATEVAYLAERGREGRRHLLHELLRQPGPRRARGRDRARAPARRLPLGVQRDPARHPLLRPGLDHGLERLHRPGAGALPGARAGPIEEALGLRLPGRAPDHGLERRRHLARGRHARARPHAALRPRRRPGGRPRLRGRPGLRATASPATWAARASTWP